MPLNIEIPAVLASLCHEIDTVEVSGGVESVITEAKAALAAYDTLTSDQKAAYAQTIRGDIQVLKGRFTEALDQAIQHYPGNVSPQSASELAVLAVQAGNPQLGRRFLQDALRQNPALVVSDDLKTRTAQTAAPVSAQVASGVSAAKSAAEMNLRGLDRIAQNDTEGAKVAFENAVDLDPGNPEHLNNLSLTQCQCGLIRQAAETAIKALQQTPTLSPGNLILATVCLKHAVAWAQSQRNSA